MGQQCSLLLSRVHQVKISYAEKLVEKQPQGLSKGIRSLISRLS